MSRWNVVVLVGLGAAFLVALGVQVFALLRRKTSGNCAKPEELLLEEAIVTAPLAPGMSGRARLSSRGSSAEIKVKATDGSQAFPRGARVRIIDYHDNCYLVEAADEEHLVH